MTDIFLSYSREDQTTARRYADALKREGFSVWWDAAINPGETFDQVTEQALKDARAVVVLWSKRSVNSRWVRSEASQADRYGTLVPVMIELCNRPIMFELSHTADLSKWSGKPDDAPWRTFVESLQRFVGNDGSVSGNSLTSSMPNAPLPVQGRARRTAIAWAAATTAIAAGAILLWNVKGHIGDSNAPSPATQTNTAPASSAAQITTGRTSVAVMPFVNLTGDESKEYFGDGMAEELINALTRLSGLQVPARSSSFSYKGRNADVRTIATELNVDAVLEGSIRSVGKTIRLTAQLADGRTGFHLWTQTYQRDFKDLFQLQDELTNEIVREVGKHFHADVPASVVVAPPTRNLEAYSLYLQAISIASGGKRADFDRGRQLLAEALRLDPGFATALARASTMGSAAVVSGVYGPEVLATAQAQAREALRLDPNLGMAYQALGAIASLRGKWVEAADHFKRAGELGPGSGFGQNIFALTLAGSVGKGSEVERALNESYRQSPDQSQTIMLLGAMNLMFGRNAESLKFTQMAVDMGRPADIEPIPRILSDIRMRAGDFEGATRIVIDALPADLRGVGAEQTVRTVYAGIADARLAKPGSDALKSLMTKAESAGVFQYDRELRITSWFTLLGDLDAAYSLANQRIDAGQRGGIVGRLWVWVWVPELLPFRRDPRFQALTQRLGLMDYWKKYGPPDSCELMNDKLNCH